MVFLHLVVIALLFLHSGSCISDFATCDGNANLSCITEADCFASGQGNQCVYQAYATSGCCSTTRAILNYVTCNNDATLFCTSDADCITSGKGNQCAYGLPTNPNGCCTSSDVIVDYATCNNDVARFCTANADCQVSGYENQQCRPGPSTPVSPGQLGCCGVSSGGFDYATCNNDATLFCLSNSECQAFGLGSQCLFDPSTPVSGIQLGCCSASSGGFDYATCNNDATLTCFSDVDCSYGAGGRCFSGENTPVSYGQLGCCRPASGGFDYATCNNDAALFCLSNGDCQVSGLGGQCLSGPSTPVSPGQYGCCSASSGGFDYATCNNDVSLTCFSDVDCSYGVGGRCFSGENTPIVGWQFGCCRPSSGGFDYATCNNDATKFCFTNGDCQDSGSGSQCLAGPYTPVSAGQSGCCSA